MAPIATLRAKIAAISYLMDALGSQIVEILNLRVQYVSTLLRNRRNPQLTRSLLISARAKKVVPARLLNLGR